MIALLSMTARLLFTVVPAAARRLLRACRAAATRHFAQRDALARLSEFDDAELLDIGLTRRQIGPAVRGCGTTLPDWPRR